MVGLVEALLLVVQLLTLLLVGVLGYFARDIVEQVRRNTRFRRVVAGDQDYERDTGRLGEFEELHDQLHAEHQEVRRHLVELHSAVVDLSEAIEASHLEVDIDVPNDDPYRSN
jgi:hypothetical protein